MKNANLVSSAATAAGLALLIVTLAGCGSGGPAASQAQKSVFDHFTISVEGHPASLQIAVLEPEQERGLMQRPDLGKDEGMLFVNDSPRQLGFWMRNTPEPLDLAYLTRDGVVAETYHLLPLDEKTVASHGSDLQFALEMPKGWFEAHGITRGSHLDLKAVAQALTERGFDPTKFGIR